MTKALQQLLYAPYQFLTDGAYRKFIGLLARYGSSERYKRTTIRISGLVLEVADALSFVWQYKEIFVDQSYFIPEVRPGGLIIDCGANIGLSSIYFSKNHPYAEIIAFEPDQHIFELCQKNLQANQCKNVKVRNEAVWIANQNLYFEQEGADGGKISTHGNKAIEVQGIDLKQFLASLPPVELLKMDVEGAEWELIPHIAEELNGVNYLFIEYHLRKNQIPRLSEILLSVEQAGFSYHVFNPYAKKRPFEMAKGVEKEFAMQLNIHCYRA